MAGFLGTRCIVCAERFDERSDIVVCPDCGTPYHRGCYAENGYCVNTALHESGKEWTPAHDMGKGEVFCQNCKTLNPPLTVVCEGCGFPLPVVSEYRREIAAQRYAQVISQTGVPTGAQTGDDPVAFNKNEYGGVNVSPYLINFSDRLCGYSPDEDFDGVKLSEIGDFVDTNTHYYLPVFKRIKDTGRAMTWNFTAMLFPELYLAHRKMPILALLVCLIKFTTLIPSVILMASQNEMGVFTEFAAAFDVKGAPFQALSTVLSWTSFAIMLAGGTLSNWVYYKTILRRISDIKDQAPDGAADLTDDYRRRGGTSALLLAIFILIDFLPFMVLYFGMAAA
jgi:hypothetical protein